MILSDLSSRVFLNLKLFNHCKEISAFYKKNSFHRCLEVLSKDEHEVSLNVPKEVSAKYLSKRIRLINKFFGVDNCLANSMCLFLAIKNRKNVSLIIGVSDNFKESSFSHCWVEIENVAVNEERRIMHYKSVISIHK